jgi:hypothetical protein
MLAATNVRSGLRVALRAACLAATIAGAAVATAQDITVTSGTANVPADFASGTYASVGITGTSTLEVDAPLSVTLQLFLDEASTLTMNADITLDSNVFAYVNGSTLSLNSGTFNAAAASSGIALAESVFQRTNGRYAVDSFTVSGGSADFVAGDSIARSLNVFDATFTLSSNLTLTGTNVLTDGLYLSGSTTSLARTNGATVTAEVLYVDNYAIFSPETGDDFTGAGVFAGYGGSIDMTTSQTLRSIEVAGSGAAVGSFTASAPITVGDGDPGTDDIRVLSGGLFVADADVTAGSVLVDVGGGFTLASGTATATTLVVNSGSLSRIAGASYQIDTIVLGSSEMDFEANDSVGSLTLTGSALFVTGTSLAALELQDLTIDLSQLILGNFDGVDSEVSGWGLKVANNVATTLLTYIASNRIVSLSAEPLSVLYDSDSNATYVTAVPEPSTLALAAAGGLLACWRTLRRRRTAA